MIFCIINNIRHKYSKLKELKNHVTAQAASSSARRLEMSSFTVTIWSIR
jgi:hypothetical protein